MQITLPSEFERLVQDKLNSGAYDNVEDVVHAAFTALRLGERFGEFEPGELNTLLAEGEEDLDQQASLDGEAAFQARRQRRAETPGEPK